MAFGLLILSLSCLLFFCACSGRNNNERCKWLNERAYYFHYRSLDSVRVYADSVLAMDDVSNVARAEALNNLAFYYIGKMRYDTADSLLRKIYDCTDNQLELCIAGIQKMRICQRTSDNKTFYALRQKVQQHFSRIYEDEGNIITQYHASAEEHKTHEHRRQIYAESEYRLVMSVYDYYIGQIETAASMLHEIDSIPCLRQDTVQYVAYLYNIGSGGILTRGTKEDIRHQELEHLMQCYVISADKGYTYWKANAVQALSEHLVADGMLLPDMSLANRYLNTNDVPDSLLAGNLAEQALGLFAEYGDVYQQAATWRTLAQCYSEINDYPGAIYCLEQALKVDTAIKSIPSLMASIHEQFSMAYSALNLKQESDYHRNLYLDLYENTRLDHELEARIEQLDMQVSKLDLLVYGIIALALLLLALLIFLVMKRRRMLSKGKNTARVTSLLAERQQRLDQLESDLEELQEQCAMKSMELSRQQETYVEQRAKMHLINSLTPLIDRMLHETKQLCGKQESETVRDSRCDYITELLQKINQQNNFLTEWIQMKKGELSLRIESFPLSPIFDIIRQNSATIRRYGVALDIQDTDLWIKADRTLTLFMLNTLCDNARKFTPAGGTISISAHQTTDDMVEISVSDTGIGMSSRQLAHLFDIQPVVDEVLGEEKSSASVSHGFGLLNCKGIVEKYKKTNALFARCVFDVESRLGDGTRFFFRLPAGIRKTMILLLVFFASILGIHAHGNADEYTSLADSVYECNLHGRYSDAVDVARLYLHKLNNRYIDVYHKNDTLMLNDTVFAVANDMFWLRDSIPIDYQLLMSVRNELAVAALALHEWKLYSYNNSIYTQMYRELSVDHSLAEYYEQMANAKVNSNVAIVLLVLLVLSFVPMYYFAYYRHVILDVRRELNRMYSDIKEREALISTHTETMARLTFEYDRLHVLNNVMNNSFSAIKHETMYYPSRLQQLLLDVDTNAAELDEVARYYRAVYGMLSAQAQYNCRYQLSVPVLKDIMLRLMAQLAGVRKSELVFERQPDNYAVYRFRLKDPGAKRKEQDVKLLILTLVVRDLGEQYDMRRSGVNRDGDDVTVTVSV